MMDGWLERWELNMCLINQFHSVACHKYEAREWLWRLSFGVQIPDVFSHVIAVTSMVAWDTAVHAFSISRDVGRIEP